MNNWFVVCDDDGNPTKGRKAHIMPRCDHDYCDQDIEPRHPICGQRFGPGWMQIEADSDTPKCKKCLKKEATDENE